MHHSYNIILKLETQTYHFIACAAHDLHNTAICSVLSDGQATQAVTRVVVVTISEDTTNDAAQCVHNHKWVSKKVWCMRAQSQAS